MNPARITKADRSGKSFEIGIGCLADLPFLVEMYRSFSPRPASQGLPPGDPEACLQWLKKLFEIGCNACAWRNGRMIGHAALIPDINRKPGGKSAEFVVFVHQDERDLGIGTVLTQFTLERAKNHHYEFVWLTVNSSNFVAIKLYRKTGFQYRDMNHHERLMGVKL